MVSVGNIIQIVNNGGYLYKTRQSGWEKIEAVSQVAGDSSTFTIGQSLTVGHLYHLFVVSSGSSVANAEDNGVIQSIDSGASNLTLIEAVDGYAGSGSYYGAINHYTFVATATTVVLTKKASVRRMGYILYDTQKTSGGSDKDFAVVQNNSVVSGDYASSFTIEGYAGKKLLIDIRASSTSSIPYNRYDGCTATGGTLTKLCNSFGSNNNEADTFFNFEVTSNTATITLPSGVKGYMIAFGVVQ